METLRGAWNTTLSFLTPYYTQVVAFARTLDPLVWWVAGGVLLALLLLWLLLRRRKTDRSGRPEVLLSLGTIGAGSGEAGSGSLHLLRLTVSNLNPYAVQVLELALKTPEMDVPVTAEVAAVVPPEGSVALEQPFTGLSGDEGRLNLYFYTAGSKRIYRLQAPFALEPWNNRYKISPLNQSVAPVRQLASAGVSRVQEQTWRDDRGDQSRAEPQGAVRTAQERPGERTREKTREPRQTSTKPRRNVKISAEPVEAPRDSDVVFPDEF